MYADARFWDGIAGDYAKKPLPDPASTARKMEVTRGLLRADHRLLDLGCGTGTILLELAPLVAHAEGLDVSPAMIRIAQEKARTAGAPNAAFRAAPAEDLSAFPDGSFDVVCAYNLLHLVEDPQELARGVRRILRPGGAFVTSTPCLGGRWFPPYALILPMMRWIGKAPAVTLLTPDQVTRILDEAGFNEVLAPEVGAGPGAAFRVAHA